MPPKILIACEESQTVCKAFRSKGFEAYSCDIQEPSGGHPEWHILGDALIPLRGGIVTTMDGKEHDVGTWNLLIAHPPCTYLSNAGARHLWKNHELQSDRVMLGIQGRDLFMRFWWAEIPLICVENPVPSKVFCMPPYTQAIQPYQFGHPYTKKPACGSKDFRRLNRQMLWSLLLHGARAGATVTNMANNIKACLLQTELKTVQKHFPASQVLWLNNGGSYFRIANCYAKNPHEKSRAQNKKFSIRKYTKLHFSARIINNRDIR